MNWSTLVRILAAMRVKIPKITWVSKRKYDRQIRFLFRPKKVSDDNFINYIAWLEWADYYKPLKKYTIFVPNNYKVIEDIQHQIKNSLLYQMYEYFRRKNETSSNPPLKLILNKGSHEQSRHRS